jgi:hypothetical protein
MDGKRKGCVFRKLEKKCCSIEILAAQAAVDATAMQLEHLTRVFLDFLSFDFII